MPWFTIHEVAGVGETEPVPGDRILGRFAAADALAALDAYSEAEGFAPYSATEMLNEVTIWDDAKTIASAPFTNTSVMAIPATSGERTDGELAMSFLDAVEADENIAEAEAEIIERLGIGPDHTEQGLTRAATLRIEGFVSAAIGRSWTYQGAGMLGVDAARDVSYEIASADVVLPLDRDEANTLAELIAEELARRDSRDAYPEDRVDDERTSEFLVRLRDRILATEGVH